MRMGITNIFIILAVAVGLLLVWARVQERQVLFLPSRSLHVNPADRGLDYEDVILVSGGHHLHGWFIPGQGSSVVLWLHGNAGNIADRVDQAAVLHRKLGASSFLVDYRGYGRSEGRPTEKGLYEDASAAFRWLTESKGVDASSIVIYGHSLGTAVAVDLALGDGRGAAGLVLESAFTSARDMSRVIYKGFPVDLLLSLKIDNKDRVGGVSMPVLVIHGTSDTTIPFTMGREVFEAAPQPKMFLPVDGADHSDSYIVGGDTYWSAWKDLMEEVRSQKSGVRRESRVGSDGEG